MVRQGRRHAAPTPALSLAAGLLALGLAIVALGLLVAPVASAQIIGPQDPDDPQVDSPWQAGTCKADPPPPGQCSVGTPSLFFEQAAGNPPAGFTQFIVNSDPGTLGPIPQGNLRTVRVDLPPGLTVNPQATEQCELEPGESPSECATTAPGSKVGRSEVTAADSLTGLNVTIPPADVYNIVPLEGEPARFGLSLLGNDVFLEADVAWEDDLHEYFTIHVAKIEVPPIPSELARILKNRLTFDGNAGDGTFITTPTTCFGEAAPGSAFEHIYSTWLRADSYEEPDPTFPNGSAFVESKIPPGTSPKNCEDVPFDPSIDGDAATSETDSPSGLDMTVNLPELENPLKQEGVHMTSHTRSARVTLPVGLGLNPSAANGLEACTDAQFGKGTRNPVGCPPASEVGTIAVETPPLPEGSLTGKVYIGQQLSSDPASGDLYRIFVTAESARYDILARLLGRVHADPVTGQLVTTFDDAALGKVPIPGLPQVPFSAFVFDFRDGPRAPLTSPGACGPYAISTELTPWSSAQGDVPVGDSEGAGPSGEPPAVRTDDFALGEAPGGGACPATLAERPFAPDLDASVANPRGGAFSPSVVALNRPDGQQELKAANVVLPPGLTARLAGVPYCPAAAIAAAAANTGAAEAASPSCPAASQVGTAVVRSGSGPEPLEINGRVFLSGPYRGAPLSLAIVTPATAGPFDLGSVAVRVALFVHRETAQVTASTDLIPHVFGGALLDIRSTVVSLDRPNFSLNPTNCDPLAFGGNAGGGGGDPVNPAAFSTVPIGESFQVNGCDRLGFKPKLFLRLYGATRRAKNPKLRAVLQARKGDANIRRAAVTLPKGIILDQSAIAKVCTRVQFAAHNCPKNARYGTATAFSPLLDKPLRGPVYLRSSDNQLPDLVASLNGQVGVDLVGVTDSVRGRIRNVFRTVPDVPVSKFILTVRGGKKGLLTNSRNLCPRKKKRGRNARRSGAESSQILRRKRRGHRRGLRALVRFKAQNGKKANSKPKVRVPCKGKKRGKRGKRR